MALNFMHVVPKGQALDFPFVVFMDIFLPETTQLSNPFSEPFHSSKRTKMTLKGATSTQACAACKYQRKRCTPECALAPHFRPEHPMVFKNAHKLFGVRNILRILEQINPNHKTEAMWSIIYEANMRNQFPVHGCLTVICDLQYQIRQVEQELYGVLTRLAFCKQHHEQQKQQMKTMSPAVVSRDSFQPGMVVEQPDNTSSELFRHDGMIPFSVSSCHNANVCINAFWLQETNKNSSNDDHKPLVSRPLIVEEVVDDHDEIYTLFGNIQN